MSLNARKIYSIPDLARETGIPRKQISVLLEQSEDEIPYYIGDAYPALPSLELVE